MQGTVQLRLLHLLEGHAWSFFVPMGNREIRMPHAASPTAPRNASLNPSTSATPSGIVSARASERAAESGIRMASPSTVPMLLAVSGCQQESQPALVHHGSLRHEKMRRYVQNERHSATYSGIRKGPALPDPALSAVSSLFLAEACNKVDDHFAKF